MADLETYRTCPVCGQTACKVLIPRAALDAESRYRERLFKSALPPGTPDEMLDDLTVFTNAYPADVVACKCGLVCRDPRFAPQASIRAYADDEYAAEWLEQTFLEYVAAFRARMPELTRQVGERVRVLEIGSYVGGFLAAAREAGWQAQGVDVGERVSAFARDKGLDVFTGTLEQAHYADHSFDAVFAWVCFDQLPEPAKVVQEIRRILKPCGWLYVQVPNGEFIKWTEALARLPGWRERIWRIRAYTGVAGFPYQIGYTPVALTRLLSGGGFNSIRFCNRMNMSDGAARPERVLPEQLATVRRVHAIAEAVYHLSRHGWLAGPWIEGACRKEEDS